LARKQKLKTRVKKNKRKKPSNILSGLYVVLKVAAGLFLLIVVSNLFVLAYDLFVQSTYFESKAVVIKGAYRLSKKDIMEQAQVKMGANILSVNLTLAKNWLQAHPWIASASVRREFPDTIIIEIKEHRPIAVVDMEQRYLMNINGELFKRWSPEDSVVLPVINGLTGTDIAFSRMYPNIITDGVLDVLRLGSDFESVIPNRIVKRILVDRELGITLCVSENMKTIKLGHPDYQVKYENLKRTLFFIDTSDYIQDFYTIDLSEVEKIVIDPVLNEYMSGDHKEA
jgi:cell division protein FtsQ